MTAVLVAIAVVCFAFAVLGAVADLIDRAVTDYDARHGGAP